LFKRIFRRIFWSHFKNLLNSFFRRIFWGHSSEDSSKEWVQKNLRKNLQKDLLKSFFRRIFWSHSRNLLNSFFRRIFRRILKSFKKSSKVILQSFYYEILFFRRFLESSFRKIFGRIFRRIFRRIFWSHSRNLLKSFSNYSMTKFYFSENFLNEFFLEELIQEIF